MSRPSDSDSDPDTDADQDSPDSDATDDVYPDTRTVQQSGHTSYRVSLLKEWADRRGIEAGTEVYLYPHVDGSLVVRTEPGETERETGGTVPVDGLGPDDQARTVRAMYVAGYDTIELVAEDAFDAAGRRAVADVAATLVGTNVVEETADRVVVRALLDPDEVAIRQSVERIEHLALGMHEDATAALFDGAVDPAGVVERDDDVDRLFAMVARQFHRGLRDLSVLDRLGVDYPALFEYYTAARQLERVADHAEKIAVIAREVDVADDEGLAEKAARTRTVVADAMEALLEEGAAETAYSALDAMDSVLDDLEALDRSYYENDDAGEYRLSLVVDSLVRTAEYGGNIAETAIQPDPRRNRT